MNIIDNESVKKERDKLYSKFILYSGEILATYEKCRAKVNTWEYSLGISKDIIPFESLIPSVRTGKYKILRKLTKANSESKNLVTYGLDDTGSIILSSRKFDKDIEKYGENVRIIDGGIILNCRIYKSSPDKNRLSALCHTYKKDDLIYYVSITPPHDWFVRIDKIANNRIISSSMFATSWFKQMDCDFIYDDMGELSQIMIGDFTHWQRI